MSGNRKGTPGVRGSYSHGVIPDFDYPILKQLPHEGSTIGGIKPVAATVRVIGKRLDGVLSSDEIRGRLVSLKFLGHVVEVKMIPTSQGAGWQITASGQKLIEGSN